MDLSLYPIRGKGFIIIAGSISLCRDLIFADMSLKVLAGINVCSYYQFLLLSNQRLMSFLPLAQNYHYQLAKSGKLKTHEINIIYSQSLTAKNIQVIEI